MEKEEAASEAEAKAAAESGKGATRPDQVQTKAARPRKKRKDKLRAPKNGNSSDSSVISADSDPHPFPLDVNIEDSLEHVAPGRLGFGDNMARTRSDRSEDLPSWKTVTSKKKRKKASKKAPQKSSKQASKSWPPSSAPSKQSKSRSPTLLSSIGERRKLSEEADAAPCFVPANHKEEHKNWGSLSSNMSNMRWDSVRSVNEFFASHGSAGPVKAPQDAPNRPKMAIMGTGDRKRTSRAPARDTTEILRQIIAGRKDSKAATPGTRRVDNSSNAKSAVDLRASGGKSNFLNRTYPPRNPPRRGSTASHTAPLKMARKRTV